MNNLILIMLQNSMIIIGKSEEDRALEAKYSGITIINPRMVVLGQSTNGVSVSIQNLPFMFSRKVFFRPESIVLETYDVYIDEDLKRAYFESITNIKISSKVDFSKKQNIV